MSKRPVHSVIRLRGVRQNNLKNFDLDLPLRKLIVITGLSGSGKSSLAFETLYAEGQRRYIETFSPYARQFFDRMDKPRVDSIQGIPPSLAIQQRNTVKTTRSTVGTMTEITDYMKVLWPHIARLHCRQCHQPVEKDSPQQIWQKLLELQARKPDAQSPYSATNLPPLAERHAPPVKSAPLRSRDPRPGRAASDPASRVTPPSHPSAGPVSYGSLGSAASAPLELRETAVPIPSASDVLVTFDLPLTDKLSLEETLELIQRQGYQRLLLNHQIVRAEEALDSLKALSPPLLTVVQDRVRIVKENRARFIEACEQAYHFGKGKLAARLPLPQSAGFISIPFSNQLHCAACDLVYPQPAPALFSFNHPLGACPACRGFGRVITINYDLAIPDPSRTLSNGAVKPWQSGQSAESQDDLMKFCKLRKVPIHVPFRDLPKKWRDWVINGDPDYGKDPAHEWPRAWYGVKGYFRWLESKAYKMHVRVLLSRYRAYEICPDCQGRRFQPLALLYKIQLEPSGAPVSTSSGSSPPQTGLPLTLADFYQLPVSKALDFITAFRAQFASSKPNDPIALALGEIHSRLHYLNEAGLGYLTLDRPTRSLSGGETERVNLTTCLGSRLVNTLFVLDEPSVGLHPRDTGRLIRILERLRDSGNTVAVVEHEPAIIRAADQVVDLGPGQGETGGSIVFQGSFSQLLKSTRSLTGQYLSGRKQIETPRRRPVSLDSNGAPLEPVLTLSGANLHNLKNLTLRIPLQKFVCITGVSGSGKTTLIREVLLPALQARLQSSSGSPKPISDAAPEENSEEPEELSANGRSARLGGHDRISRAILVDQSPLGRTPRSNPAVYTGAFEHIRELFAQSDSARQRGLKASSFSFNSIQGQCDRCRGAGFEKIEMQFLSDVFIRCPECQGRRYRSHILEILLTPDLSQPDSRHDALAPRNIADLLEATVTEAIRFLSLFPSRHAERAIRSLSLLQEAGLGYLRLGQPINTLSGGECQRLKLVSHLSEFAQSARSEKPALFLFDEPTTGLHLDDVRVLLRLFQRLVDSGHSIVVIEHHLDLIQSADWVVDLGPEAGDQGGRIVAQGTPEDIAACPASHTGQALRALPGR